MCCGVSARRLSGENVLSNALLTVDDILELEKWIEAGATETDRDERLEQVREHLFSDDLDEIEVERRQALIAEAKSRKAKVEVTSALPSDAPVEEPTPPAVEWQGFIPKTSRAYKRGSLHDGTAQEMDEMRSRSRGSPFSAEDAGPVKRRR